MVNWGGRLVQSKRSRWELIYDVLKVTYEEKRSKKTRIMQRAYLDWRNFKRYFELLIDKGFITKCTSIPDNYEITEKGMKLLESFRKVDEIRAVSEMLG
jgi:predicted transcriptional regulator